MIKSEVYLIEEYMASDTLCVTISKSLLNVLLNGMCF